MLYFHKSIHLNTTYILVKVNFKNSIRNTITFLHLSIYENGQCDFSIV